MLAAVVAIDPFDLPEWLGSGEVTWVARSTVRHDHRISGELRCEPESGSALSCDLLAADRAYPVPVLSEEWRRQAHQSWTYDQVLLVEYDATLTLVVPGVAFTADRVLEAIGRLAKAVGASPSNYVVALRL